ncbi:MAG: hypothetical protein ACE5JJ_08500 [Nitrospinota bacterium]
MPCILLMEELPGALPALAGAVKEELGRVLNRHLTAGKVRGLFFSELHIL